MFTMISQSSMLVTMSQGTPRYIYIYIYIYIYVCVSVCVCMHIYVNISYICMYRYALKQ